MPSPFPGMDPYLERPYRWLSMHPQLVSALPDLIAPLLPERYVISVEESMLGAPTDYHYGITVSRAWMRPRGTLLPFTIRDPIPPFPVPLREGELEPMVDIAPALAKIYASNSLDRRIDYGQEPDPPLAPGDAAWVDSLLRENGLR